MGALGGTGRILEVGSGGGRDARVLERRGLSVRCTDVAQGFVDLLRRRLRGRSAGPADRRSRGPATSRHTVRRCLVVCLPVPRQLARPRHRARSARQGDQVGWSNPASFKEGDGEDRSTYGAPDAPRRYTDTLWREPDLRSQFSAAGWVVDEVGSHGDQPWLAVEGTDHDAQGVPAMQPGARARAPEPRPQTAGEDRRTALPRLSNQRFACAPSGTAFFASPTDEAGGSDVEEAELIRALAFARVEELLLVRLSLQVPGHIVGRSAGESVAPAAAATAGARTAHSQTPRSCRRRRHPADVSAATTTAGLTVAT